MQSKVGSAKLHSWNCSFQHYAESTTPGQYWFGGMRGSNTLLGRCFNDMTDRYTFRLEGSYRNNHFSPLICDIGLHVR